MSFISSPQLLEGLEKAYVISSASEDDINNLLKALGNIRSLLLVQAGPDEEELMKNSLKYAVFFLLFYHSLFLSVKKYGYFSYFSTKTYIYIVGTHQMDTHQELQKQFCYDEELQIVKSTEQM